MMSRHVSCIRKQQVSGVSLYSDHVSFLTDMQTLLTSSDSVHEALRKFVL